MSLVNSNRKENIKRIDRGHEIKPKEQFKLDGQRKANIVDSVTFYANVRINNHIKNRLEALSTIGLATSQKDAMESAINYYIESLPDETKRKLKTQIATLEERDVLLKNRSK